MNNKNEEVVIGVDFGGLSGDKPMTSVIRQSEGVVNTVEVCELDDFDYSKYVASKHQIIADECNKIGCTSFSNIKFKNGSEISFAGNDGNTIRGNGVNDILIFEEEK